MHTKDKLDLLIKQNAQLQAQILGQEQRINELIALNSKILANTDKMTKHIDFINASYEKITKSYFFKNMLGFK